MSNPSVVIIGGGLAGLSAATGLAPHGYRITLLDSRPRLGGRASSFTDPTNGQLIDACQHVSMGCCTNLAHFLRTLGIESFFEEQRTLRFMTPDRRISRFAADPYPAPWHLSRALASAHYLTPLEKIRVGYAMLRLMKADPESDPPLVDWLRRHFQTQRILDRYWNVVLTSALNESIENVGLKYARKVFMDGFVAHRDAYVLQIPRVPLGRLYGPELRDWLRNHGVTIREETAVKQVLPPLPGEHEFWILLRDGTMLTADHVILAVPFDRVLDLLPDEYTVDPFFARIRQLQPSPITSLHFWWDRAILPHPNLVLVDCLGQWVFTRDSGADGEHYVQVVVSASREARKYGNDDLKQRIYEEMLRLFPAATQAKLLRSKVVTEHSATFRAVPGVDRYRPPQVTPVPGLFLAGDWTATGWPATMEGAVRSGYLAAESLLKQHGKDVQLCQPGLGRTQ